MSCSTCDSYEFVPDASGLLVDCPDCRAVSEPVVRCPAHGRRLVDGRCPACRREATVAEDLLAEARTAAKVERAVA